MRTNFPQKKKRPRTLKWEQSIDDAAVEIARNLRFKGGVSELLSRLIVAEKRRKRGIAHLYPRTFEERKKYNSPMNPKQIDFQQPQQVEETETSTPSNSQYNLSR